MMKWYQEPYFDPKTWMLSNYEKLSINSDELVLLLIIQFAKEHNIVLTYDYLTKKLNKNTTQLDVLISSLVNQHYLMIKPGAKGLEFDIDQLFEFDPKQYELIENQDIYDVLTEVFNRPLSSMEMQKASDLINQYGNDAFSQALRISEAYRKVSMGYIESVLKNHGKD